MLLLFLNGCAAVDSDGDMRAWLAPFCVFNCVVDVIYAPGIEQLRGGTFVTPNINH